MATLQTVLAEATKLNREIERILKASTYSAYRDLSGLDIDTTDSEQLFLQNELCYIMDRLADAQAHIEYLNLPVSQTTSLHRNGNGQYEIAEGYCLHCGYPL